MGTSYGPNIVIDGLVFYIDPFNPRCYSGSGNTLIDLSGNGYHASKTTGLSVSGGWLDWGSSANGEFLSIPKEALHGLEEWTIEFALYITSITSGINTLISCGAGNDFLWYLPDHTQWNVQNTANISLPFVTSTATNFLMTAKGSGGLGGTTYVFKNAELAGLNVSNNTAINVTGTFAEIVLGQEYDNNATGGFDNNQAWLGKMGTVRFYNRELSSAEIRQNYDAHRTRYGL